MTKVGWVAGFHSSALALPSKHDRVAPANPQDQTCLVARTASSQSPGGANAKAARAIASTPATSQAPAMRLAGNPDRGAPNRRIERTANAPIAQKWPARNLHANGIARSWVEIRWISLRFFR